MAVRTELERDVAEAGLRLELKVVERALELTLADISGGTLRGSLARQVNALRDELNRLARQAYGVADGQVQAERLMAVARFEIAGER